MSVTAGRDNGRTVVWRYTLTVREVSLLDLANDWLGR